MRAGLIHDTYIECSDIQKDKKSHSEANISEEVKQEIQTERSSTANIYEQLAKSIAPEIFGHLDVKKSLILMMTGGVNKVMKDGMKIRGNLNVLLMGDPGVAKSQLLKYISRVCPRGIYTTGKGASAVGLTAGVHRDPMTREWTLEGGALVLADKGICLIDEFDKMNEQDRTSIHEAMEQQSISISKAGIHCSLNARCSVIAAANPIFGDYDRSLPAAKNIGLPDSLLSRFDLVFAILDEKNPHIDARIAERVIKNHQYHN